jgi:hypothetical protein
MLGWTAIALLLAKLTRPERLMIAGLLYGGSAVVGLLEHRRTGLVPIAGGYNLVVFSHSSVTGTFNNAQVVHVIVQ